MLLGLSGTDSDPALDAAALEAGAGLPHGALLVRFADTITTDSPELGSVRAEAVDALGFAAMVDAAAVVANFTMMVRIADGTGTPLDGFSADISTELREGLGINDLPSARLA